MNCSHSSCILLSIRLTSSVASLSFLQSLQQLDIGSHSLLHLFDMLLQGLYAYIAQVRAIQVGRGDQGPPVMTFLVSNCHCQDIVGEIGRETILMPLSLVG